VPASAVIAVGIAAVVGRPTAASRLLARASRAPSRTPSGPTAASLDAARPGDSAAAPQAATRPQWCRRSTARRRRHGGGSLSGRLGGRGRQNGPGKVSTRLNRVFHFRGKISSNSRPLGGLKREAPARLARRRRSGRCPACRRRSARVVMVWAAGSAATSHPKIWSWPRRQAVIREHGMPVCACRDRSRLSRRRSPGRDGLTSRAKSRMGSSEGWWRSDPCRRIAGGHLPTGNRRWCGRSPRSSPSTAGRGRGASRQHRPRCRCSSARRRPRSPGDRRAPDTDPATASRAVARSRAGISGQRGGEAHAAGREVDDGQPALRLEHGQHRRAGVPLPAPSLVNTGPGRFSRSSLTGSNARSRTVSARPPGACSARWSISMTWRPWVRRRRSTPIASHVSARGGHRPSRAPSSSGCRPAGATQHEGIVAEDHRIGVEAASLPRAAAPLFGITKLEGAVEEQRHAAGMGGQAGRSQHADTFHALLRLANLQAEFDVALPRKPAIELRGRSPSCQRGRRPCASIISDGPPLVRSRRFCPRVRRRSSEPRQRMIAATPSDDRGIGDGRVAHAPHPHGTGRDRRRGG